MRALLLLPLLALGAPPGASGPAQSPVPGDKEDEQEVLLQLLAPAGTRVEQVETRVERPGGVELVELRDDGQDPLDLPGDGIYVGRSSGPYARYLRLRLTAVVQGEGPLLLYDGMVYTADEKLAQVGWTLEQDESWAARRTALLPPGGPAGRTPLAFYGAAGWAAFLLLYVQWLAAKPRRRKG